MDTVIVLAHQHGIGVGQPDVDNAHGSLQPPVIGRFKDRRGEFYAQEIFDGKHIFSRFIWSNITASSCRWEQAFSADGGQTWETNWIMELFRQP
jgi:hypothetical protein